MGLFISFEGPDGSGKSTQIKLLAEHLNGLGQSVFVTREPGGTEIGEQIRDLLHDLRNRAMHPRAEILLYSAARAQLVGEAIVPRLAEGAVVLCDRYADSTLAYQGYGHGLDLDMLRLITGFATQGLKPDLTLLFDIDPADGLRRRSRDPDRIEAQDLDFHRRVRQAFRDLAAADPERFTVVDATAPAPEVAARVQAAVLTLLDGP